jgi:hypothetical protein
MHSLRALQAIEGEFHTKLAEEVFKCSEDDVPITVDVLALSQEKDLIKREASLREAMKDIPADPVNEGIITALLESLLTIDNASTTMEGVVDSTK